MVRVYGNSGAMFNSMTAYVTVEDYEALQAALREALDAWEFNSDRDWTEKTERRIAALRAKFLDEGTT